MFELPHQSKAAFVCLTTHGTFDEDCFVFACAFFKIGRSQFLLKISHKIHRWARFELQSRKDCTEKLGAVGALYRLGKEGFM